jgi:hypothetical protein
VNYDPLGNSFQERGHVTVRGGAGKREGDLRTLLERVSSFKVAGRRIEVAPATDV